MKRLEVKDSVRDILIEEGFRKFGNGTLGDKTFRYCLDRILERDRRGRYSHLHGVFGVEVEDVPEGAIEAYMTRCIIRATAITADFVDKLIATNCPQKTPVHEELCKIGLETDITKRHLDRFNFVIQYTEEIMEKFVRFKLDYEYKLPN